MGMEMYKVGWQCSIYPVFDFVVCGTRILERHHSDGEVKDLLSLHIPYFDVLYCACGELLHE